jgi:hypothetical protein
MLGMAAWAQAQDVPLLINYQGKLQDGAGKAVPNGNYEIAFKVWSDASAGTLVWGRTYPVHVMDALFNVVLGDGGGDVAGAQTTDLRVAFQATNRFLGLTITKDQTGAAIPSPQEIVPRQQFLSAPYAIKAAVAGDANKLGGFLPGDYLKKAGDTVGGNLTVNGALGVNGTTALSGSTTVGGNLTVANGSFTIQSGSSSVFQVTSQGTINGGLVPVGGIIMWSGTSVPAGWALCDGTKGTPDLRNKFVLGQSGGRPIGAKGGAESVTLSIGQLPSHTHPYLDYYFIKRSGNWRGGGSWTGDDMTGDSGGQWLTSGATGNGDAVSTMPPYYVLAFIMRTL